MSGNDVLALQRDLSATGFRTPATGTYTRVTMREIKVFQKKFHLQVDGIAGPATFAELRSLLSSVNHITEVAPTGTGSFGISTTEQSDAIPSGDVLPSADSGGVGFVPTPQSAPVVKAQLIDGLAVPGPGTPETIVKVIEAANQIAFLPYVYGGGHSDYATAASGGLKLDRGYDCSGSVSFALHGGGLLADPLDSEQFASYGNSGKGSWITVYTNGTAPTGIAHAYMEVAGLWFDTAAQSAANGNDRWSTTRIAEPGSAFMARHPAGW
ncbi:MAG TPA: peptidoglycan-binding domain-containing protein [Solirubrobacteraceae bacterium]|nr:peptidoglycan-binding domain-containing protein [Solirubrobacteraceae bacterium]